MGGEEVGATAGEARQAVLTKATETMFDKWGTYLKGEVQASVEDHLVLEKLHTATAAKFQELAATAGALNGQMAALQAKHTELKPQLEGIDSLEASVDELMRTAVMLDEYAQRVEQKYKSVIIARRS